MATDTNQATWKRVVWYVLLTALSILVLFLAGFALLTRVRVPGEAGTPVPVSQMR